MSNLTLLGIGGVAGGNTNSIDLESGSSQYLSVADSASLSITGNITIEAWVKMESATPTNDTSAIAGKINTAGSQFSYQFYFEDDAGTDYLYFQYSDDGSSLDGAVTRSRITHSQSVGTWVHYAVTATVLTQAVTFYVNGTATTGTNTLTGGDAIFDGTAPFRIGAGNGGTASFLDGLVDDVRVWSVVRTGTEISDNRSLQLVGNETNLQGYWRLNDSLLDQTANDNDLTNNGLALFSTDVPFT